MSSNKNKITHPALIIWAAIIVLILLSSVKLPVIPYINSYSHIDLLQDIKADKKSVIPIKKITLPAGVAPGMPQMVNNAFDSTLIVDYADDASVMMQSFYSKLNALKTKKGKVRIAYFGDSFIEADYITGELRDKLQAIYGGSGPGFVPMQSIVADDYVTFKFNSNTSWADYNFHNNPQKYPLGLMGHVFYSTGRSWSQYSATNNNKFKNIYLYTGKTKDSLASVTVDEDDKENTVTVNDDSYINKTVISSNTPVGKLKLSCTNTALPVYGLSMEDSTGVYIDNYGFRGNTGALSLQLQPDVMKGFASYFKYDLIIVHYGLNVLVHNDTNYLWFDRTMAKFIEKIKTNFPGAPILLVGSSDVAYNEQGTYVTDPGVPVLVRTENEIARKNKVAFWNLYYSMGGESTMAKWVEGDTTFAYRDYMHVNERGANKIAGVFLDKLLHSQK